MADKPQTPHIEDPDQFEAIGQAGTVGTWTNLASANGSITGTYTLNAGYTIPSQIGSFNFSPRTATSSFASGWAVSIDPFITPSSRVYNVRITAPPGTTGSFRIGVDGSVVDSGNNRVSATFVSNAVTLVPLPSNLAAFTIRTLSFDFATSKFNFVFRSSRAITNLSSSSFQIIDATDGSVPTGWTFDAVPSSVAANTDFTVSANIPSNTNGNFTIRIPANVARGPGATSNNSPPYAYTTVSRYVDTRASYVATPTWDNVQVSRNRLLARLNYTGYIIGLSTGDIEVIDEDGNPQSGWNILGLTADPRDYRTGQRNIVAIPPASTAGMFRLRLRALSIGGRSSTPNSPAANVDTAAQAIDNRDLTYDSRTAFTYPTGISQIHANIASDDNGFYFAQGNTIYAYDWDGTRASSRDVTLSGMQATDQVWGFTKNGSNWAVMTRESTTNPIARIREFSSTGSNTLNFTVANTISTVSDETFRAPKGLAHNRGHYYIRVVRTPNQGVTLANNNMRLLKYTDAGAATNENIVLGAAQPDRLSDLAAVNNILYIIQQSSRIIYATDLTDSTHALISTLQETLNTDNTAPWATTIHDESIYVADRGGYLYEYTGVPSMEEVVVLTASWSNARFSGGLLRADLAFSGGSVSGIEAADFQVVNASGVVQTGWTIAAPVATGLTQTISATPPADTGPPGNNFALRLRAERVRGGGATMDNSPATAVTSATALVDNRPVIATVTWGAVTYASGKLSAKITFSSTVSGIETTDFEVIDDSGTAQTGANAWTFDSVTGTGTEQTITAAPPANTVGSFGFRIKRHSVQGAFATMGNSPATAQATATTAAVDNRPAVVATATWSNQAYDLATNKLSATITFSSSVTDIDANDFYVVNRNGATATGWTIDPVASSGTSQVISFTAPPNRGDSPNDIFSIVLRKDSVRGARATANNSPTSIASSQYVGVNNKPTVLTAAWDQESFAGGRLQARLTFSGGAVNGIEAKDFDVVDEMNNVQMNWTIAAPNATAIQQFIVATPPDTVMDGEKYAIVLQGASVEGPRATSDNSPATALESSFVTIDTSVTTGSSNVNFGLFNAIVTDAIMGRNLNRRNRR